MCKCPPDCFELTLEGLRQTIYFGLHRFPLILLTFLSHKHLIRLNFQHSSALRHLRYAPNKIAQLPINRRVPAEPNRLVLMDSAILTTSAYIRIGLLFPYSFIYSSTAILGSHSSPSTYTSYDRYFLSHQLGQNPIREKCLINMARS